MNKREILQITDSVEGWLSRKEGWFLYRMAGRCKGNIVEIGSWKGKSTVWLGLGSKSGNHAVIHAVDPHTGAPEHVRSLGKVWTFDQFQENIRNAGIEHLVHPLVNTSEAAAADFNEPVEFLFIDGAHEYEAVRNDLRLWSPKLVEGGFIAFHDTTGWYGPRKVVADNLFKGAGYRGVGFVDSMTFGQKCSTPSATDLLMNKLRYLLFIPYALVYRNLIKLKCALFK